MKARKVTESVFWVGAVDWDRRLFDGLVPLPDGTSYNAYFVSGAEKNALVDTVEPSMTSFLLDRLDDIGVERLDYVIANHAEQDHSGSLPQVLARYPTAKVVVSTRGKKMLTDLLAIAEDRIITVEDGEKISLGDKTLEFVHLPWVHWPETMGVFLHEDGILFSCDFFGSHVATSALYCTEDWRVSEAIKMYYAEIMMPFRTVIRRNLEKLERYPIEMIAPSHGPIHNEVQSIVASYKDWVSDNLSNSVVLPYISMHGSTEAMVSHLTDALVDRGVRVDKFNLAVADLGRLAISLVDAATIVVGSPTILAGAHPQVVPAAFLVNALRPKLKFASVVGSYGWGGRTVEQIAGLISGLKLEILEPVMAVGFPKAADFAALDKLAEAIVEKHRGAGIG